MLQNVTFSFLCIDEAMSFVEILQVCRFTNYPYRFCYYGDLNWIFIKLLNLIDAKCRKTIQLYSSLLTAVFYDTIVMIDDLFHFSRD